MATKLKKVSRVIAGKRKAMAKRTSQRATPKQTQQYLDMVAPPGRPVGPLALRKVTLTLDNGTTAYLRQVGDGSMSEGTRRLAREARSRERLTDAADKAAES